MNTCSVLFALFTLIAATPNPSPIDAGTAHVVALNNNLGCSSGTCNATNVTSAEPDPVSYASGAWASQESWSPFAVLAAGGLAFSTGLL